MSSSSTVLPSWADLSSSQCAVVADLPKRRRPTTAATKIPVVVVESHQHVLEHIHFVLRRHERERLRSKKRSRSWNNNKKKSKNDAKDESSSSSSSDGWSMLHFDAHPDLACCHPTIPAKACFQPAARRFLPIGGFTTTMTIDHDDINNTSNHLTGNRTDAVPDSDDDDDDKQKNGENGENDDDDDKKKTLYELLDSTSTGIAEWILPLVLAANLKHVDWIRPTTTTTTMDAAVDRTYDDAKLAHASMVQQQQLPMGFHRYNVGAWIPSTTSATTTPASPSASFDDNKVGSYSSCSFWDDLPDQAVVKVDLNCPYYAMDETTTSNEHNNNSMDVSSSSYAPTHELCLKQPLHLTVSEMSEKETAAASLSPDRTALAVSDKLQPKQKEAPPSAAWMLDICLDYFACYNPYLVELEQLSPRLTHLLVQCVYRSIFYQHDQTLHSNNQQHQDDNNDSCSCHCPPCHDRMESITFRTMFGKWLQLLCSSRQQQDQQQQLIQHERTLLLERFYCSHQTNTATELFDHFQEALQQSWPEDDIGDDENHDTLQAKMMDHTSVSAATNNMHNNINNNDEYSTADDKTRNDGNDERQPPNQQRCKRRRQQWVSLAVEALPNLGMPHAFQEPLESNSPSQDDKMSTKNTATTTTIYHSPPMANDSFSKDETVSLPMEIQQALNRVEFELKRLLLLSRENNYKSDSKEKDDEEKGATKKHNTKEFLYGNQPPFMVTIARSAVDGFTPNHVANELQNRILAMVHDCYCGCGGPPPHPPPIPEQSSIDAEKASCTFEPMHPPAATVNHDFTRADCHITTKRDCSLQLLYDYGPWEGSTLENESFFQ